MKGLSLRKSPTRPAAWVSITKMARRYAIPLAMLGLASAFGTVSVTAASFPCAKAATPVEKLICADTALSSLDEKLAASYRQALEKTHGDKEPLREGQRLWLAERNRCADVPCLKTEYDVRLAELELYTFGPVVKPAKPSTKPDAIPAAELGATGKYPPYPEVWGYELSGRLDLRWRIDNGDYVFVYVQTSHEATSDTKPEFESWALQFFSGTRSKVTNKSVDDLRRRFDSLSYDSFKETLINSSTLTRIEQ